MKIYTIRAGNVEEGAIVETLQLKGAGLSIPAITIGETGRGRSRGALPVRLPAELHKEWLAEGRVEIFSAQVGQTRAGKPRLVPAAADSPDKIIIVLRTPIGFRGSNSHTGDRSGWTCDSFWGCGTTGDGPAPEDCPECGGRRVGPRFSPFPGQILVEGTIAQGDAGRMGSGRQMIATVPKGVIFRTGYSGRLYGSPPAHYYLWDGDRLLSATWEERTLADLF